MTNALWHSMVTDGDALSLGGLCWPRPYFPTRCERAALIASHIPGWATARSHTAGWIWTGMGSPTPLSVLRPTSPALSPLERERWKARELRPRHHVVAHVGDVALLDPVSTEEDVLCHATDVDAAAAQIIVLRTLDPRRVVREPLRMSSEQRERAKKIATRVRELQSSYPDITR